MAANPLLLAVDTNVLLDFAVGEEDILDALALIQQRLPEAEWLVPPSVLDELAFLCDSAPVERVRFAAGKALKQLGAESRFRALLEVPFGEDITRQTAQEIRSRELLPSEEVNDSLILAEAALLHCGVLLTSDAHLRAIDHGELSFVMRLRGLDAPLIATPREILRKFFR